MKNFYLNTLIILSLLGITSCKNTAEEFENPFAVETVKDCEGNIYPVVKIGEQYWMAENMKATKYDSESERAGETIPQFSEKTYLPFYLSVDTTTSEYVDFLTEKEMKKMGLLYNWAAAVGAANEEAENLTDFTEQRQGICPNGFHIPTKEEWEQLDAFIAQDGKNVGTALRTIKGWDEEPIGFFRRTNDYGFDAVPAAYSDAGENVFVGYEAFFWSSTSNKEDKSIAYNRGLICNENTLYLNDYHKYAAESVRCIKNNP